MEYLDLTHHAIKRCDARLNVRSRKFLYAETDIKIETVAKKSQKSNCDLLNSTQCHTDYKSLQCINGNSRAPIKLKIEIYSDSLIPWVLSDLIIFDLY